MAEMNSGSSSGIARLILVPSVITLLVTILRLIGELQHWSRVWFNAAAGGGGAIIGITWLVPIFGVYFALKLTAAGEELEHVGRAILLAVLGLLAMAGGTFIAFAPQIQFPGKVVAGFLLVAAAAALQLPAWPALFKTLLAYSYAARIPVAVVMFFAIQGHWGTHYDVLPPGFSEMSFWSTYVRIGLLPQLIFWVVFTVIVGSLFGSLATAIFARRMSVSPAH
jgi:hypothetical protein